MSHGTQQVKSEKRARDVEAAPASLSRRRFLTYLGAGSAAMAAGSAGVLPNDAAAAPGATPAGAASQDGGQGAALFFAPIEPTDADELVLPEGYKYDVVAKWGDNVPGADQPYGYNNDFTAYFPVDALDGGESSVDGILWVNHEYPDPKWVSEYTDPDNETPKTKAQISAEKASVGGSLFRVRREGAAWKAVSEGGYGRRIDATTPMDLTGPAAGSAQVGGVTEVIGTLANCSGGVTPWNTVLSCEENFQDYYGERSTDLGEEGAGGDDESPKEGQETEEEREELNLADTYRWLDDPETAQRPEHYGWVVEVDPYDPDSKPRKHSWLGRVRHENCAITFAKDGRVVVYT